MKRRIIAALTALVMVVTMIPASAFAATTIATAEDINAAIKTAGLDGDGTEVAYEYRGILHEAYLAYDKLNEDEKEKVKKADKLQAAENAFVNFDAQVKTFKESMAQIGRLSLQGKDVNKNTEPNKYVVSAVAAYDSLIAGVAGKYKKSASDEITVTFKAPVAEKIDTEYAKILGASEYKAIKGMKADGVLGGTNHVYHLFVAINNMATVTQDDIDDITSATLEGDLATLYQAVQNKMASAKNYSDYAFYAMGYDKVVAVKDKIDSFDNLTEKENKILLALCGGSGSTVMDIEAIHEAKTKDIEKYNDFVKALDDAKALIAAEKNVSDNFKEKYDDAKEYFDRYETRDAVLSQIKAVKPASEIRKLDLESLMAEYEKFKVIDEDVAAVTSLAVEYSDMKDAFADRFAEFKPENTAKLYAEKILDAIEALPATPTRADVDKIDGVIDLVIEYDGLASENTSVTEEMKLGAENNKTVFDLASPDAKVAANSLGSTKLATALTALDSKAWTTFVAKSDFIVQIASENVATLDALAALLVKDSTGALPDALETINDSKTAEAATKVLKEFDSKYAALDATLKADFDAAVDSEYDEGSYDYGAIPSNRAAVEKAISEVPTTPDQEYIAQQVIVEITSLVAAYDDENLFVGNSHYEYVTKTIASIDTKLADPAVKKKVLEDAELLYKSYLGIKADVDAIAPTGEAPKAVIAAIDALKVIDLEKDTVTKELVDNTIAAYEATLKSYEALTAAEKTKVTNYDKMAKVVGKTGETKGFVPAIVKVFNDEADKIGTVSKNIALTDAQKATINGMTLMIKQYEEYVALTNSKYTTAKGILDKEVAAAGQKEYEAIVPLLDAVKTKYYVNSYGYTVNKNSAKELIAAVDAVSKLSEEAYNYAVTTAKIETKYAYANLVMSAEKAKALLLEYATVTVEDQEYTGEALTPAVVVKDANGAVVDASQYTVAYSANTNPGTATVIVTAKADANVAGTVQGTFKITIDEPVKAEITGVKTDFGVVRVYFDRNEEVNGEDVMFQVQYKKSTSDKWLTKYPTKGYEYLTLRGLAKNGKYDVRVRAYYNEDGQKVYGEYSDVKSVYANKIGTRSSVMYKAVIKSLTTKNGSVTMTVNPVKYTSVPDGVTWKLSYKKYGSQYTTWTTKTTKSTTATFKNLKKGTRYVFRAQYSYAPTFDKNVVNSNYSVYKNIVVK